MSLSFLPSQDIVLNKVCQFLNVDCNYVPNESSSDFPFWKNVSVISPVLLVAAIAIISILILTDWIISCFGVNGPSRNGALVARLLFCIGSFGICIAYAAELHGYNSLVIECVCFVILFVAFAVQVRSQIELLMPKLYVFLSFVVFFVITVSIYQYCPQTVYPECNFHSLSIISTTLFMISVYLTMYFTSLIDIVLILNAEHLYIKENKKNIGYLVKKGTKWEEIYFEQNEKNTKEDLYFIV